ncbi:short-chain fatty acid transporter [Candidatus Uabimicrobium amorphum]|uniref:Short-chain fatty acids transporter n=1 Tax=Uabimicrobium amorphum TaxID=2596890 RepID=A0A5S9F7M6_UABAM|nr:TIGR00366 family protein [Candidatus Uabimicrobium amorphum]BBM87879.1 short-chain fatty acids transporter [Candidatus Uabimicrobium amorphum]
MLNNFSKKLCDLAEKYMPEPFTLATMITFFVCAIAVLFTPTTSTQVLEYWYKDFWSFLPFSMQMCMILVTGFALSTTTVVKKMIRYIARWPKNNVQATFVVSFISIFFGFINWGLALIIGAFLARQVAIEGRRKNISLHYPILGAAGYMGLAVWHGGLSGSAPLLLATKGHFLEKFTGIVPVYTTLFSPLNIACTIILLIGIPVFLAALAPRNEDEMVTFCEQIEEEDDISSAKSYVGVFLGLVGCVYIIQHLWIQQKNFDLNILNFSFLFIGILLHRDLDNYFHAVKGGVKACAGIILLFPFYAGIKGIMVHSGLAQNIAQAFADISSSTTLPIYTFISSGITNFFIPSGGGQWIVQGDIVIQSSQQLGISTHKATLAFCYGDQWTNLLQPFWALALLEITGLRAKDIMGYCMAVMLVGIPVFITLLYIFH